jgi:hypothetical protein
MHYTVGQVAKYLSIDEPTDLEAAMCYYQIGLKEVRQKSPHEIEIAAERMKVLDSIPAIFEERLWYDGEWNREGRGVEYGVISDWGKISAGEYWDIKEYQEDFWNNVTKILSILYRKVRRRFGENYDIEKYQGTEGHEIFNSFPAQYLNGCMLFFSTVKRNCGRTLLSYLTAKATTSAKSGVGMALPLKWRGVS